MNRNYGYCRISRKSQNIERQERNIKQRYPDAIIYKEVFTGTKVQGRKKLDALLKQLQTGDNLIFDSASRMSRNADEAMELYDELFAKGVNLIFLKEPQIDTETYKRAMEKQIAPNVDTGDVDTNTLINEVIAALNKFSKNLAKAQIRLVFDQAEKEVEDLHKRTSEGLETAKRKGKRVGASKGDVYKTKKGEEIKKLIKEHCVEFVGIEKGLRDGKVMKLAGTTRNTFYKYKKELLQQKDEK